MALSATARRALYARQTAEVFVDLVTITHPDLGSPLRFVSNTSDVISRGSLFIAAPFSAEYPPQIEGGDQTVTVTMQNIDLSIEAALASLDGEPTFTVELVLASHPDHLVAGPFELPLRSSVSTKDTITMTLGGTHPLLTRQFPRARFSQAEFPGLSTT